MRQDREAGTSESLASGELHQKPEAGILLLNHPISRAAKNKVFMFTETVLGILLLQWKMDRDDRNSRIIWTLDEWQMIEMDVHSFYAAVSSCT